MFKHNISGLSIAGSATGRFVQAWRLFSNPGWIWVVTVLSLILGAALEPMIPAMLKPLLDKGFVAGNLNIWTVPAVVVLIFLLKGLTSLIAQIGLAKIATMGIVRIREELFERVMQADPKLFDRHSASSLANTIIHEIQQGAVQISAAFLSLAKDSFNLVALVAYLLYLNWKLTVMVTLIVPLMVWAMKAITKRLTLINRAMQQATDDISYTVEENALAFKEIRIYGAQTEQSRRFERQADRLARLFMKSTLAIASVTPITQFLSSLALSAVLTVALIQSSTKGTTVGEFAAFITAMLMIIAPLKHLSEVIAPLTRGLVALEKAQTMLRQFQVEQSGTFKPAHCSGQITFNSVFFKYQPDKTWAVQDINIRIEAGQRIALVGGSGSGKTTLTQLLCGFLHPQLGDILVDGKSISDWDLRSLRSHLAVVSQTIVVLQATLAENVALGQTPDPKRVTACLHAAHLGDFVNSLPLGIDSVLGHNASQMSGGQRQRLAIARALYKDAPIVILDEATSALDRESEQAIDAELEKLFVNKTVLIISHKAHAVRAADQIFVLKDGRIHEQGTHTQLIALQGLYSNLFLNDTQQS